MTINNQWSNRYTMVEVTGLDRPGLLFELTATLSKLNLNIGSAHVATFGERVVDVFYVTDLFGAKITSATRQATIKRALISLFRSTSRLNARSQNRPKRRRELGPPSPAARGQGCLVSSVQDAMREVGVSATKHNSIRFGASIVPVVNPSSSTM